MTGTKEYICKICEEVCPSSILFTYHLKKQHNLSRKEYFDKYVEPIEHKCPFCDNERKWYMNQYRNTCGNKYCNAKWSHKRMHEIYGVENISQLKWVKDKKKKTCNEHFGFDNPSQSKQIQIRKEETCFKNNGVRHPLQSLTILQKLKNTCKKIYNTEYANQSSVVKDKIKKTTKEHYGVEHYAQNRQYHINKKHKYTTPKYPGISFDSTWEIKLYDFLKENNIPFEFQINSIPYIYDSEIHYYNPDFLVDGRIYEVKGDHFFRINETTGKEEMYCPYRYPEWSDEYYAWRCGLEEAKHQCMISNDVIILRKNEMNHLEDIFQIFPLHLTSNVV